VLPPVATSSTSRSSRKVGIPFETKKNIRRISPKVLENLKGRYSKRVDLNKTLYVKRQFAFTTPQSGISNSDSFRNKNLKCTYLNTSLGDETKTQRKRKLKKKLELFGFNDKAVNKLIRKNLNNKANTKRFRSTGTRGFRDNTPKVTNLMINRRSINLILKKQVQIIGKKKQDIHIDINDIH
jgi:hypothetical protein